MNPFGGGMRRETGRYFSNFGLPGAPADPETARDGVVNRVLSIGADFRTLTYFANLDVGLGQAALRSFFFPMQFDLYVKAQLHERIAVLADVYLGASPAVPTRMREFYAIADGLPWNSWVMAGYFVPPFGLKQDDHTLFTRRDLGFDALASDAGVAFGMAPGRRYFDVAITNGIPIMEFATNAGAATNPAQRREKAVSGHLGYFHEKAHVGFTWHYNLFSESSPVRRMGFERTVGLYHSSTIGPITWLGELDLRETENAVALPTPSNAFPGRAGSRLTHDVSAYGEVNYLVRQGLNVNVRADFRDPLWEGYDDTSARQYRLALGTEWQPLPSVELIAVVRRWFRSDRYEKTDLLLQLHLFL